MKKIHVLQIFMIILFVSGYGMACAQDYLVSTSGDTIQGKVKYFNNSALKYSTSHTNKYVQVTTEHGKKITYQILQTISFRIKGEVYHTIKFDEGYTFMKLIAPGYLSLYSYQMSGQTTWDGRYFVKRDGGLLDVPNIGFKKRVSQFLADCPTAVEKIESGALNKANLPKIIEEYNACITQKSIPKPVVLSPAQEAWNTLENDVKALPDFDKKADALEMIGDIQRKLARKENIPSFLTNGLSETLKDQSAVKESLDKALELTKK